VNIVLVDMADVDRAWGLIGSKVTDCLAKQKADITAADLWIQCRTASAFVVLITDDEGFRGAIVWRFETWPDGLVMRAIVAVGDAIEGHFEEIYAWCESLARSMGATRIAILGTRPGWGRAIKRKTQITYNYIFEVPDE
jgi:hypothetical protein